MTAILLGTATLFAVLFKSLFIVLFPEATDGLSGSDSKMVADVEEDTRPAVIGNQEWMDVQTTLSSLQQQMQIIRLQQFKIMQLLATQNQNTNSQTPTNCGNYASIMLPLSCQKIF